MRFRDTASARFTPVTATFAGIIIATACIPPAQAQTTDEIWKRLREAERRPGGVHAIWKRTMLAKPTNIDVDAYVENNARRNTQTGMPPADVAANRAADRRMAERMKAGQQTVSLLDCLEHNGQIRCEIFGAPPVGMSEPPTPLKTYHINYFDGTTSIATDWSAVLSPQPVTFSAGAPALTELERMLAEATAVRVEAWKKPLAATLTRNRQNQNFVPNVGAMNLSLMVGRVWLRDWTPENATVRVEGDTIVLEKKHTTHMGSRGLPMLSRWVYDAATLRPHLHESRFDFPENKNPIYRLRLEDYRRLEGSIALPGRMVEERFSGSIGLVDEKPGASTIFELLKAESGVAIDFTALKLPFPVGTTIRDTRFAPEEAYYKMTEKGIPTDEEVKRLAKENEFAE